MKARKTQKVCEGCRQDDGARFRALVNLYLCWECYTIWHQTGTVPSPQVGDDGAEERRW